MRAHIDPGNEPQPRPAPGELGLLFDHLHCLASAQIFAHMAEAMRSIDLSFSQINALFRLFRYGPQRIAELAESARLTPCAASRLADRLVRDGLATKQRNPENRRERLVRLTDQGRECVERLRRSTAEAYDELFTSLPGDLTAYLFAALRRIDPLLPREPAD